MCRVQRRGLRQVSAKHSHTTHVLFIVHYPHHPLHGQTVTVVRRSVSFGPHQVQVALSNGYQLVIPEWMLDEERCQGMKVVEHPTVALSALLALRSLIDAQPRASSGLGPVVSEASSPGGAHESTTPGSLSVGDSRHAGTPETVQTRCRELLSHMLLAVVSGTTEEGNDEREDTADPHGA